MAITLPEDGTIIDVNEAFVRLSGYPRDELVGRNREELGTWVDKEQRAECFRKLRENGFVQDFEASYRKKNGQTCLGLTSAKMVEIDSQDHVLWVVRDISEQRRTENALRNSHQKLSTTFQLSPNALILTRGFNGEVVEINEAFVKLCEIDRQELVWKTDVLSTVFADHRAISEFTEQLKREGVLTNAETEVVTKSGVRRICIASAKLIFADGISHVLWSFQDITEKKLAENALRISEEKFSAAFRASPDAVLITRLSDGCIVDINESMVRLTGYEREEMLGHSPVKLGFWVNTAERDQFVSELLAHGRVREQEVTMRAKDGGLQLGLISAEIVAINGQPHSLTIFHDLTHRRMAEIELKSANSRLTVLSARLIETQENERRNLARELHDEIGQSLTAQKMALDGLCIRSKDPALCDQIERIARITDRLLNQVRQISLNLRPPQLDDLGLVAAIRWNVMQQCAVAHVVSHFSETGEIPVKLPESVAIASYRIVQEALTNVIKHSEARNVWVSLQGTKETLLLVVRDDGKGFVPTEREHLTRMGLAGMAERAQMIGGQLNVAARPGIGCTISAEIPLQQPVAYIPA